MPHWLMLLSITAVMVPTKILPKCRQVTDAVSLTWPLKDQLVFFFFFFFFFFFALADFYQEPPCVVVSGCGVMFVPS